MTGKPDCPVCQGRGYFHITKNAGSTFRYCDCVKNIAERDGPDMIIHIDPPDYSQGWWLDMPPDTAHYYCPDWQNGVVPMCVPHGSLDDDGYPVGRAFRLYEDYERRPRPEARPWIDMGKADGEICKKCLAQLDKYDIKRRV